jgi:hypothetical protein
MFNSTVPAMQTDMNRWNRKWLVNFTLGKINLGNAIESTKCQTARYLLFKVAAGFCYLYNVMHCSVNIHVG